MLLPPNAIMLHTPMYILDHVQLEISERKVW